VADRPTEGESLSAAYGAWELKASYQRNLTFGLVSSLLLSSGVFLATYFLGRVRILPADTKTHTIRVKLTPSILRPSNSSRLDRCDHHLCRSNLPEKVD